VLACSSPHVLLVVGVVDDINYLQELNKTCSIVDSTETMIKKTIIFFAGYIQANRKERKKEKRSA